MELSWNAAPEPVQVGLSVDQGVALSSVGLSLRQFDGSDWLALPAVLGFPTASVCRWNALPINGEIHLLLRWIALDPMKPNWAYDATIDVAGPVSPRAGSANPEIQACQIGPTPPNTDFGDAVISIYGRADG